LHKIVSMIYQEITRGCREGEQFFFLLVDPDKQDTVSLSRISQLAAQSEVDLVLIGGSLVSSRMEQAVERVRQYSGLPVMLFPGNLMQLAGNADGILLLSLISGRNPEFLIGNHVQAAPFLNASGMEIIPTAYILVEGGTTTSVEYMSNTRPVPANKPDIVVATAMAGEMMGQKMIYLEAGSGALHPIKPSLIRKVKQHAGIPVVVGGGIRTPAQVKAAYDAGADVVVVGTAVEEDPELLSRLTSVARFYHPEGKRAWAKK
jgi:phosphoglycerol geranylgeranyltransferase